MKQFDSLYKQTLSEIHRPENARLFEQIMMIIEPHGEEIVDHCYRVLLGNSDAKEFLNQNIVNNHLKATMVQWLQHTFLYCEDEQALEAYFNYQAKEGHIYACIALPVSLINYGMRIIKMRVFSLLNDSSISRDELSAVLILASQVLDWVNALVNETCQNDLLANEKSSQSLKLHVSTQNLAFDCERLRTSLSEWMRGLLLAIQQNRYDFNVHPTIRHSNFGLWVMHKGPLFLTDRVELTTLTDLLDKIDEEIQGLNTSEQDSQLISAILKRLNEHVSHAIWVLGNLANEMLNEESGRDPLTHLFNRRYLDTIMRYETAYNLKKGTRFGLLMIDIDFFKQVNDNYGHDNGDRILVQLAEILTQQVRAGDFVFRLGGEEFLVILSDVNQMAVEKVAENIRHFIEKFAFYLNDQQALVLTVSIGTAIYDGHPDYNRTIKLSDDALYEAKENGRNQVVAAEQVIEACHYA